MSARKSSRSKPKSSSAQTSSPRAVKLHETAAARGRRHGQRVPEEVRLHALSMLASGMRPCDVAESVGVVTETLRNWRRRAEADDATPPSAAAPAPEGGAATPATPDAPDPVAHEGAGGRAPVAAPATHRVHAPTAPHDPGQGLGEQERAAVLELEQRHPSMGPAQIRAQLKRFKGWRVSVRAIGRVLRGAGYELVHVASRPKGEEEVARWEAPHRNAVWQADFVELRVGPERAPVLLVQDDHSRFVVAHELMVEPTSEKVVEVLRGAITRHGRPETLYTDRGGPFLAWRRASALSHFLEKEGVDHSVSPAYRPQGRGKVESLAGTLRRELWEVEHMESSGHARAALGRFFQHFNHRRAHMGIDGLVPADRFFGRAEEVLAHVQAASRRRQGALVSAGAADPFVSEESGPDVPFEMLRLVVTGGRVELRFLGHRVDLGPLRA